MVANEKWFGASADFYSETIDQSLRFDDGSNCRMSRIVGTTGDRQKFTFSVWLKRTNPSGADRIFEGYTSSTQYTGVGFDSSARMRFDRLQDGVTNTVYTNAIFRDATNWYHCVWSIDTTQATESNRVRFYVNGTEFTDKGTAGSGYPTQNLNLIINVTGQSTQHAVGRFGGSTGANFDGYMAELNHIDGQQLDASYFGESKNGVWIPKDVSGLTYGTNGFRCTFADSSDLGNNANSTDGTNDFDTVTNLASTDVVLDTPTNNFSIWNANDNFGAGNLSDGNTKWVATSGSTEGVASTFAMPTSGKWYWEWHIEDRGYLTNLGLTSAGTILDNTGSADGTRASWGFGDWNDTYNSGVTRYHSTGGGSAGTNWSGVSNVVNGDILACAYDADNGTLWFAKNGTFLNSSGTANPATNTDPRFSGLNDGTQWFAYNSTYPENSPDLYVNFGQDSSFAGSKTSGSSTAQDANGIGDFYYTPPSGFLALCASNLPSNNFSADGGELPTDYMGTAIWSGNDTARKISLGFQADWVWTKMRSHSNAHYIFDSSRGDDTAIYSNLTQIEGTGSGRVSFGDSDGFDLGTDAQTNGSGYTFASWNWRCGGSTPTKTYKVVVVSDSGNKYRFRNSADSATFAQSAVTLDLQEGGTYTFDLSDSSMSGHPLRFSSTSDGTHGGGSEYTTGVTTSGTAGSSGATVTITVASSAPTLYYYCTNHSGMGGQIDTNTTYGSTNFDGTILSVEQSNTTSGISILTYTGTGTQSDTVGHSLGAKPKAVIVKSRSEAQNWHVYHEGVHESAPHNYVLVLNATNDRSSSSSNYWGGNTPTTTVMGVGNDNSSNKLNQSYVMYLFNEVEGFSKFGSYYSLFSTDGNYINCGFRPQWVMIKAYAGVADASWVILDDVRDTDNYLENYMMANQPNAETTNANIQLDFLSNGFKIRKTNTNIGGSGDYYVFFAFARQDFKFSNAR